MHTDGGESGVVATAGAPAALPPHCRLPPTSTACSPARSCLALPSPRRPRPRPPSTRPSPCAAALPSPQSCWVRTRRQRATLCVSHAATHHHPPRGPAACCHHHAHTPHLAACRALPVTAAAAAAAARCRPAARRHRCRGSLCGAGCGELRDGRAGRVPGLPGQPRALRV